MPARIQLSRRKGWRKPQNTLVVARPSKWGNPFRTSTMDCELGGVCWQVSLGARLYAGHLDNRKQARERAVELFALHTGPMGSIEWGAGTRAAARAELAGKNLACWCSLDQLCHADVLLEIANG